MSAEAIHLSGLPKKHLIAHILNLQAELDALLKLDGSRAMTGNLDAGGNNILDILALAVDDIYLDATTFDVRLYRKAANVLGIADDVTLDTAELKLATYVLLKSSIASLLQVRNVADTDYGDIRAGEVQIETVFKFTGAGEFKSSTGHSVEFQQAKSGFPPSHQTVATMVYSATPNFQLDKAGDITGLANKTLDFPLFKVGGVAGVDGSFTTVDGKTVTVTKGLITSIV